MVSIPYRDREGAAFAVDGYPLGFLITFRCYGTWLHGDVRGSVSLQQNMPGSPLLEPAPRLERYRLRQLQHAAVTLDDQLRGVVDRTIHEVCEHQGWQIHACNVRSNHVHVVVTAACPPEKVMNALKSWSTRRLREAHLLGPDTKPWSRHGSTRYLWNQHALEAACLYTTEGQGNVLDGAGRQLAFSAPDGISTH